MNDDCETTAADHIQAVLSRIFQQLNGIGISKKQRVGTL